MRGKVGKWLFHIVLFAFILYILGNAFILRGDLAILPLLIGIPTFFLLVLIVLGEFYPRVSQLFEGMMQSVLAGKTKDVDTSFLVEEDEGELDPKKLIGMGVWLILFAASLFFFGFLYTVPVFSILFGKVVIRFSWPKTLVLSAIPTAVTFAALILMDHGVFEGWFFDGWIPVF